MASSPEAQNLNFPPTVYSNSNSPARSRAPIAREKIPGDAVAVTVFREHWTSMVVTRAQIHKQPSETEMSDTSSSSSVPSGRVTKLTKGGRVPAQHFMDIPKEDYKEATRPWKRGAIICAILAIVLLTIMVLGVLGTYHVLGTYPYELKEIDLGFGKKTRDFVDFIMQKMAGVQDMRSNMDFGYGQKTKDFADFIMQKMAEVQDMWSNMDLGYGEKPKKYFVKITREY